jgi:hypothetical protein
MTSNGIGDNWISLLYKDKTDSVIPGFRIGLGWYLIGISQRGAWEAEVLPLNYTRKSWCSPSRQHQVGKNQHHYNFK